MPGKEWPGFESLYFENDVAQEIKEQII